jgi:hypothetical protein
MQEPVLFYLEYGQIPTLGDKGSPYKMTEAELLDLRASPNGAKADAYDRILRNCSYEQAYAKGPKDEDINYRQLFDDKIADLMKARKLDYDDPKFLRAVLEALAAQEYTITAKNYAAILQDIEKRLGPR